MDSPVAPPSPIRKRVFSRAVAAADECAICMQPFAQGAEVVTLSCPHVFHWACLEPWITRSETCPTCRIPLALPRGWTAPSQGECTLGSPPQRAGTAALGALRTDTQLSRQPQRADTAACLGPLRA